MELEKQCCNFDQAALIFSYVIRFETFFWWYQDQNTGENYLMGKNDYPGSRVKVFPSYLSSELGKILPAFVTKREFGIYEYFLEIKKDGESWIVRYVSEEEDFDDETVLCEFTEDTEAEAKAEAVIFLLEKKWLKADEVEL